MKVAWIVVAVAIIAGGAWWLLSRNADTEEAPATTTSETKESETVTDEVVEEVKEPQSVVITFTNTGFTPESVTINVGDSVTFVNESSGSFQPASDPHPTHTGLAGFDAGSSVAMGQSYTFTFTKTGTWGFHDHLDSDKKGTVIVR